MATFILVHGTFATNAEWPALQDGLSEAAAGANEPARFERVLWSGKNQMTARQSAANAILALVEKIRLADPTEKIFVIGHSHGGSAVAYFLKQYPEASNELARLIHDFRV